MRQFKSRLKHRPIVLLSFCDGIGSSRLAIEWLMGPPRLSLAWEIDEDCIKVTQQHFPEMIHRGCFLKDNYQQVATMIKQAAPSNECQILLTAGTPCPDFSVVSGKSEGRNHPEGAKFKEFSDTVKLLKRELPQHTFVVVAENVVMNDPSDCQFITEELGIDPVVIDSADHSLVSRTRLWWADVDWQSVKTHPLTGHKLVWSQHNGHRQVRLGLPAQEAKNIVMGDLCLHDDVLEGKRRIPCFTTPCPSTHGRPPPQRHKLRTSEEAKQRWLSDNRQFAPWQYADHAMAWRGNEAVVIPPDVKEQLHNYPRVHQSDRRPTQGQTQDVGQFLAPVSRSGHPLHCAADESGRRHRHSTEDPPVGHATGSSDGDPCHGPTWPWQLDNAEHTLPTV